MPSVLIDDTIWYVTTAKGTMKTAPITTSFCQTLRFFIRVECLNGELIGEAPDRPGGTHPCWRTVVAPIGKVNVPRPSRRGENLLFDPVRLQARTDGTA